MFKVLSFVSEFGTGKFADSVHAGPAIWSTEQG